MVERVKLVHLGEADLGVSLAEIARVANRAQCQYEFFVGDQLIRFDGPIGDSGVYVPESLLQTLISDRSDDGQAIVVGITYLSLHEQILSTVDQNNQAMLVTTHPDLTEPFLNRVKTNLTQWVLFEIAAQLLTIEYRRGAELNVDPQECELPWHKETRSCIFDYSDVLTDTSKKLMSPKVCSMCENNLDAANIGGSVRGAFKNIINRALRIRLKVAFQSIIGNPFVNLFAGAWLATASYDSFVKNFYPYAPRLVYLLLVGALVAALLVLRKSPKL